MVFECNYMKWRKYTYEFLEEREPENGEIAQDYVVGDTDGSKLTERERLMGLLPLIKWMVEHDMLTPECKVELKLYFRDYSNGVFDGLLGEDEEDEIRKDLFECYHKVFGE